MCDLNVENNVIPPMIVHSEHVFLIDLKVTTWHITKYILISDFSSACSILLERSLDGMSRALEQAEGRRYPTLKGTQGFCPMQKFEC